MAQIRWADASDRRSERNVKPGDLSRKKQSGPTRMELAPIAYPNR